MGQTPSSARGKKRLTAMTGTASGPMPVQEGAEERETQPDRSEARWKRGTRGLKRVATWLAPWGGREREEERRWDGGGKGTILTDGGGGAAWRERGRRTGCERKEQGVERLVGLRAEYSRQILLPSSPPIFLPLFLFLILIFLFLLIFLRYPHPPLPRHSPWVALPRPAQRIRSRGEWL